MAAQSPARFVVFSMYRSGTTMLTRGLNEHPSIVCHSEIFHNRFDQHIRAEWLDNHDAIIREDRPIEFTRSILDDTSPERAVGFKIFYWQNKIATDWLLWQTDIKKIILERENVLARFASAELAKITGIWYRDAGNPTSEKPLPIAFDAPRFHKFVKNHRKTFAHYRSAIFGPALFTTHTELITRGNRYVQEFLGVPFVQTPATDEQLYTKDILSRFRQQDHDAVRQCLHEVGCEHWANE